MKQRSQFIFLILVSMITFFSCKKDKTQTELLTAGNWIYTSCIVSPAYDYYGNGNPVTDIYAILNACEKDDFETFKTNGTCEYNQGLTKCDQSSPQVLFTNTWSFTANETKMFVGTIEHTILELTSTTLKLQYTFEDAGVIYTEVDTFRH